MKRITPIVIGWSALIATACATKPEAHIKTEIVEVPTPIACVPASLGPPPVYIDDKAAVDAAEDAAARYLLFAAGRDQRTLRLDQLEPVIAACRAAALQR